jgi:hypothetical protein
MAKSGLKAMQWLQGGHAGASVVPDQLHDYLAVIGRQADRLSKV